MTMDEKEEIQEVTRPRGRKVGVRQMENIYLPEFKSIFVQLGDLLRKRCEAKKMEIREIVKESLGVQEVIDTATAVAKKAKQKFEKAKEIHEEAKDLQAEALAIANASKIIKLNLEEEDSTRYSRYNDADYDTIESITVAFTEEFDRIIEASMLLQREHLDLEFLDYQRKEYLSQLRKCITMEECVAVLKTVQSITDTLEAEHKKLLEQQETRNERLEGIRSEREDDLT
jgi:hypothetical protein